MIRFRPAAAREFAADFRYYEKDHPERGGRSLATNRFWVDHAPVNERDPFNVFVVHTPEPYAVCTRRPA